MTIECTLYHLRQGSDPATGNRDERTLCGRRASHDATYVVHVPARELKPLPVETFGVEAPDGRWFPCCQICIDQKNKFDNLQTSIEDWV